MILNTPVGTPIGVTYEEMRMTKEKWKQEQKLNNFVYKSKKTDN